MELSKNYQRIDAVMFSRLMESMSTPGLVNFGGGSLDSSLLPSQELSELSARLLSDDGARLLQYGAAQGLAEMLDAHLQYLAEYRSLKAVREELLIVNGGTQGIDLTCQTLLNEGDTVLVEAPTFLVIFMLLQRLNVRCIGVQTDENGMVLEDLQEKMERYHPKMLYVIPTFQNPSGIVTSLRRRQDIYALAQRYDVCILEDDPYYDLRYEGQSLPMFKSMDEDGRVIALSSYSKIISPGLRVGAVCAPQRIIAAMTAVKQGCDMHTPSLNQALCAEYVRSGALHGHIEQLCAANREKRDRMLADIQRCFPKKTAYVKPQGGLFLWLCLPEEVPVEALFTRAIRERGVVYIPGSAFYPENMHTARCIRLNFACTSTSQTKKGIEYLGALFSSFCSS